MPTIHVGETWTLTLADKTREVTVLAATGSPAWWRCADLETGFEFNASVRWFVGRVPWIQEADGPTETGARSVAAAIEAIATG